ncbi:putative Alpha-(1,3)-fucosyltransferase C [Hypsibius exemplaris]|uniref:Fucosyltransferase n=1 Tax=Hypsibius exemplaris TaxID=2072580 RepID=A0A1W0WHJ8_HYPEX|nr:putative Alpha-(1,3)-fucosyltransferase C [Hypsibius exemplaris]
MLIWKFGLSASSRKKIGPRVLFQWVVVVGIVCVAGWYFVSRTLLFSRTSWLSQVQDPVLSSLEQEIEARKGAKGVFSNLFPVDPASVKQVLFWTSFFGTPDARGTLGAKLFEGCPVRQCAATNDRNQIATSDAVIFHALDISSNNLPGPRRSGQHYIFLIGESPANLAGGARVEKTPEDFFDMTFTYRLDSDVRGHYLYSVPVEKDLTRNFAEGKRKLVAWFVSNCITPGRREEYVKELQKYIPVDVYGKCGPLKCPRNNEAACNDMLNKDYKFYLSFENSICNDYVTEKLTNALHNNVVPIAMNGGNMTIFPDHSYIHVEDFPSARALAEHLQYLDKNDTAYNEYMRWRFDPSQVQSHGVFSPGSSGWCMLCERLHDPAFQGSLPGYRDARQWFLDGGQCRPGPIG